MIIDEMTKSIFELKGILEHVMFKEFGSKYDMPKGLNQTHMITLLTLQFIGPSPMSDLSQRLNIEKGSFTPVANKLIQLDYIQKQRNNVDKRIYELSLTSRGSEVARKFEESHIKYIKDLLDTLDDNQKDSFFDAVSKVNEVLRELSKNTGYMKWDCL